MLRGTIVERNNCREEQLSRGTIVAMNNCREGHCCEGHFSEEQSSRGTLLQGILRNIDMMALGQYRAVLASIWWYWVSIGQYWLVLGDTGSVQLRTIWY